MTTDGTREGSGDRTRLEAAARGGGAAHAPPGGAQHQRPPTRRPTPKDRRGERPPRGRSAKSVVLIFVLAAAAFFSASAFLDAGPREGDGSGGGGPGAPPAQKSNFVPPGMRCAGANLCEEGEGARKEAPNPPAEPEAGPDDVVR